MKIDITKRLPEVDEAIARTTDPWHLAIINNYVRHAQLEVCGWYDDLLGPDMMVEHPIYRFHTARGVRILDGMDAVREEYESYVELKTTVMYHTQGQLLVNDYGFMTEYVSHRFWPGSVLRAFGDDIDDPAATYVVSTPITMAWPFDERLRLKEERVYIGSPREVRKCDPAEIVTMEECREKLGPIIPPLVTPEMVGGARA